MRRKEWPAEWISEALRIGKEMWKDHYRVAEVDNEVVVNAMVCPSRSTLLLTFEPFACFLLIYTTLV